MIHLSWIHFYNKFEWGKGPACGRLGFSGDGRSDGPPIGAARLLCTVLSSGERLKHGDKHVLYSETAIIVLPCDRFGPTVQYTCDRFGTGRTEAARVRRPYPPYGEPYIHTHERLYTRTHKTTVQQMLGVKGSEYKGVYINNSDPGATASRCNAAHVLQKNNFWLFNLHQITIFAETNTKTQFTTLTADPGRSVGSRRLTVPRDAIFCYPIFTSCRGPWKSHWSNLNTFKMNYIRGKNYKTLFSE